MKLANAATPVALVVLAIGAAGYAYFVDRGRISDADRAARRTDVFPTFRVDQVRRIELVHGAETLVLERVPPDPAAGPDGQPSWSMTRPHRDATDPAAVDTLLRELEMATRVRTVNDGDAVGLDVPRVRGTVEVGPIEYRFALGADAVTPEGAAYLRLEGEGTCVVERSVKVQLLRDADAYRDKALVPYSASDVARLELSTPSGGQVALERRGTTFRIGGPDGLRASRAAVDHLFGALSDVRAESFVDDAGAEKAASQGIRTATVIPRDPSRARVSLVIGGPCPNTDPELKGDVVVVRTSPPRTAACVARGVVDALDVNGESLVDDSAFIAHADEIEEVRLESLAGAAPAGGVAVDLARRGAGWHERAPEERELGAGEVDSTNALVAALAEAHALDVRRAPTNERFAERSRATIVRTGGGTTETIEVSAPDANGVSLARRLDDGAILRLPRAVARRFEPHPIALAPDAIWRSPLDAAAVVAIDDSCSRGPGHLELDDGTWKLRGFEADAHTADDLAAAFTAAKAEAWVDESDDGSFGFGRDGACVVTLTLQPATGGGSPRRVGMVFGAAGEGGVYARAADGPGVFVVPVSLRDLASHPAIDRSAFRLDLPSLVRVVVARGDAKIALSRSAATDALERSDGDGGADKLEGALAGLHADAALHAGPPSQDEGFDQPTLTIETAASGDGGPSALRIVIGAPTHDGAIDGYFARVGDVEATFIVTRAVVHAILDAW